MAHVANYKKEIVKKYVGLITEYPIVGIVNMENLPAQQLQKIRAQISSSVILSMSKKRLIKLAIEQSKETKKGIEALLKYLHGMSALIFTKENPFKLFKLLSKNKTSAPAKPGQTAPKDIIIKAGATSFAPGPIISEISSFGLKVGVEAGKVAIKQDCLVARKGEVINEKLANILMKLGEKPMDVCLDLTAVFEDGLIFTKEVLDINENEFTNKLIQANAFALNLAIDISYPTKETIKLLIYKAFINARTLAVERNIFTSETVSDLLGLAEKEYITLKDTAGIKVEENKAIEEPDERKAVKETEEGKEDKTESSEEKIKDIVRAMKEHASGEDKKRSAEFIVKELEKEEKKDEIKQNDVPKAEELAKRKKQDKEHIKAHELLNRLKKEGTLRSNEKNL